jgi:hypothetical protein
MQARVANQEARRLLLLQQQLSQQLELERRIK